MLIDKHTIKIIGSKYDHKKDKRIKELDDWLKNSNDFSGNGP